MTTTEEKIIPKGWQVKTIDDVSLVFKGKGLSKDKIDSSGKNKCILYGQLFTTYNEIIKDAKSRTNSDEGVRSQNGDILMPGSTTTKAEDLAIASAILEDNVLLGGDINILRKKDNTYEPAFLAYYITHHRKQEVGNFGQGITIIHLYGRDIKKIQLILPPLSEQKKIAEILSTIDDEIKKTSEVISQTEKLKKGLMRDLFTKGIGHKKFKKTKIGAIPEEWEVLKLSEIAQVERGKFSHRPRNAPEFYGGDIPFIQTGDVVNSNGKISSYTQTLNEKGLSVSKLFKKGTIVITIAANIGDTGILQFDSCFPDSLIGITPSEKIDSIFLEYYLRTQKEYLNSISTQSAQKNINLEKLKPLPIILPAKDEQEKIAGILLSVDEKILINTKYRKTLRKLKKGLMSDLLSGKVRTI
ncbi:MAG: restriction endonuclease subunit S [Candidatus Buchananbacteria bacterium]